MTDHPVPGPPGTVQTTRRKVLQAAMVAALGLAAPVSVVTLALPGTTGRKRYVLFRLADGKLLAVDLENRLKVLLLTPRPVADGRHPLARSGALVTKGGKLTALEGEARSSEWELSQSQRGTIRVRQPGGRVVMRIPPAS